MKSVKSCCACFAAYTELAMSTVKQSQAIPFTGPYSLLVCHLRNLTGKASSSAQARTSSLLVLHTPVFVSGDVEELDGTEKNTLKVFKSVTLIHQVGMVLLEVSGQVWVPSGGPHFNSVWFIYAAPVHNKHLPLVCAVCHDSMSTPS